ncbi:ribosomal protein S7 [Daldinia caldariorum]|uniref:ribosomal protein S7 n=1 Tax=Daldinia caldariorum TaxID=326644 RepID=UPI00200846BE|nr:ribosomal protein S7 [Daldinia caldariorum]KAI1473084.1 ribosomal protein S7 [Daldinia caldariorum]
MSCKLSPWGAAAAVRNLSVRTRRIPTTPFQIAARPKQQLARHHQQQHQMPFLITTRGFSNDTTSSTDPPSSVPPETPYVPTPPEHFAPNFLNAEAIAALEKAAAGESIYGDGNDGLLFDMPDRVDKDSMLQSRYHPVVEQVTKLIMKDGKLAKAQRNMAMILNYLRTSPAPKVSPLRPLLPGSPPPEQLPLNPLLYLTLAIDSVAPLIRIRSISGAAGGGRALELPQPIAARARRRMAVMWIMDVVRRKRSAGSGRTQFATRFAQELVFVVEGKSTVWEKRNSIHRLGTAARANLSHPAVLGKKMKRR